MSVQMNQYLACGYWLDYKEAYSILEEKYGEEKTTEILDDYYDSAFEKNVKEINGCSLIMDVVCGEYLFFGKVFNKSKESMPLNTMVIPKITKKIKLLIEKEFNQLFGETDKDIQMIIIANYR